MPDCGESSMIGNDGRGISARRHTVNPIRLEVIAPTFEGLGMCTSCELVLAGAGVGKNPATRALEEYPKDWQDDYQRLTDWVYDLAARYGGRLLIKVIDPQSPEGLLKSLRHRIRRYPTFVIDGKKKVVGWQQEQLEAVLKSILPNEGIYDGGGCDPLAE